ncbi:DUF2332 domain-containing protein [Gracilibacillus xinjiangensis]|uniref:DUF2332 domain-containing protein n=1 Tax=Gracilibacillus xinjiangensis TaxID=1193282 RepID=A0ABV8WXR9_9BACI
MKRSILSERFRNFAERECKGSSSLYENLSHKIAEDSEILELCSHAKEGQPVPNLLFGAVHFLLIKGKEHPLSGYYPSLVDHPLDTGEAFPHFKDFCRTYEKEITTILTNKFVQTNEVRRCAYLYPCFCYMFSKAKKPLSLIEIGTSAGLQLLWDKYSYSYGTNEIYGDKNSAVHVTSKIKGGKIPSCLLDMPPVASKIGIDLHISDIKNMEDYLWLKSLIWPEHKERLELFERAATCFKENSVELLEGDGIELLSDVVETIPNDTIIGIFHTHVANQIPDDLKHILIDIVRRIGQIRDLFHLYNNMWDRKLHLDYFINGVEYNQVIGETDGHGRWFEWNLS